MISLVFIALGGAFGALCRYGVNLAAVAVAGHGFPWGSFSVNVLGSFLMGALIAGLAHYGEMVPSYVRMFAVTGFLGAFTTFSTFSLDAVSLWERGDLLQAGLYAAGSVLISILALILGLWLVRSFS